jgi:chemotaxis protein CheD
MMPMANRESIALVVGVADLGIARTPTERITTFALGSCLGVTVFDPLLRLGGLLHFLLPQPGEHQPPVGRRFAMYATTGVPVLLQRLAEQGLARERAVVCVAGGARAPQDSPLFALGDRNRAMLRRILRREGIAIVAEDTGGTLPRTMTLELDTGAVTVRTRGGERALWVPAAARS